MRRRGELLGGSKIILPQKSLKSWYSETPFLVFWEHNFCLKCLIIRLWFLFSFTWLCVQVFDFILHLMKFLKFCGVSVFITKYTLICIHVWISQEFVWNHQNRFQKQDFSYPGRILVGIRHFQAKSRGFRRNRDGQSAIMSTLASKMETYITPKGIAYLSVSVRWVRQSYIHDAIMQLAYEHRRISGRCDDAIDLQSLTPADPVTNSRVKMARITVNDYVLLGDVCCDDAALF